MPATLQQHIHDFWFTDALKGSEQASARSNFWHGVNANIDYDIERRFGKLVSIAKAGQLDSWRDSSAGCMALIILLDQFPRNIYRGKPDAFASDAMALSITKQLIDTEQLYKLHPVEQSFALLPLEHSEILDNQVLCVQLFKQLRTEHYNTQWQSLLNNSVNFAEQHLEVIAKFNRFPHRNEVLNRISTDEELNWLQTGTRFGQ